MKPGYFFISMFLFWLTACTLDAVEDNTGDGELTEETDPSSGSEEETNDVDDDSSEGENSEGVGDDLDSVEGTRFVAGHEVAKESVLRSIPKQYLEKARENFYVAYQHTSHGTHVTRGVFGLTSYKDGDENLFGVSRNTLINGKLTIYDYAMEDYASQGKTATDLSVDETAFIQATRNFLDDPDNAHVNVVMWSWCDISKHKVEENYLPGMSQLIAEYGKGGSKIGTGPGQREEFVHFIFMTGHAVFDKNVGEGRPKNQADLINTYCQENKLYCLDYYSIDTHDMDGNYWEDAGDDGYSDLYGGNFYQEWQASHTKGVDYWENRLSPGGEVAYGAHNSQHITANRKAMAFWWILARLAGWDGEE
ncbi:hypothetical protein ACT29H_15500 [Thermophagus sp. OGC60D27]|uniref:hypothetical protein n=1 Tax=Thermophagus sp. OGC60D27 TaxID=3458415 RepID=UPI004037CCBB